VSVGISELDLYWDDSATWRSDTASRNFDIGDRVSLFGKITAVDEAAGKVTVEISGIETLVMISNETVVLLERSGAS
jgi:hypothetical protein